MIGRNIGREEISEVIISKYRSDDFAKQLALTDIIMEQVNAVPVETLTLGKIREIVEEEIMVFLGMEGNT